MPATWRSRIPEVSRAIPIQVGAAMAHGTEDMATAISENAPRGETGDLQESIEARPGSSKFTSGPTYGIWARFYWFFSEYGTVHEPAHPWLMPAVESNTPTLVAEVREALARL